MGFGGVITNAYIAMKGAGEEARRVGIHRLIGFPGVVMTDSGGYQVLEYGGVEAQPLEVARFQEEIGTDIAVILDQPTGMNAGRRRARETVEATYQAARETMAAISRADILWSGPVQGGRHLELVELSARYMSQLPFHLHALGSPVEVMNTYNLTLLVDMIIAAKRVLPPYRPLHLFGAGHPLTLPLAVALGCDLFDSASYILYAKDGRYMTSMGTVHLEELDYFPCSCPVCSKYSPQELRELSDEERVKLTARHNLHLLLQEMKAIKQAIREGRLWDLLRNRASGHPALWAAFVKLAREATLVEEGTPLFKPKALLFTCPEDLARPEAARCRQRLLEDLRIPAGRATLVVVLARTIEEAQRLIKEVPTTVTSRVQVAYLHPALGLIPHEIRELYPLSQNLTSPHLLDELVGQHLLIDRVKEFLEAHHFQRVVLVAPPRLAESIRRGLAHQAVEVVTYNEARGGEVVSNLLALLKYT
jgi:7-cyano-7-deazaguanine tRNA-ribosyltransferase